MTPQYIINAVEIFHRLGVRYAVLSPGSRSAPITLAFARHPGIRSLVIPDERSAGFIALGVAQATGRPAVVVTTSGTAVLNLAPALTEAFYRHIPLIAFTADRPPEWIDQADGQTIRQTGVFQNHIRGTFTLPAQDVHKDALWHSGRIISEAFNRSVAPLPGPVHINAPIREPFYPEPDEKFRADKDLKVIQSANAFRGVTVYGYVQYLQKLKSYGRVLIIAGQHAPDKALASALSLASDSGNIPVIGEITSNIPSAIRLADLFVNRHAETAGLKPDLLITFGGSVISKNIKTFIRHNKPVAHWHISPWGQAPDTFQSLTGVIAGQPAEFFNQLPEHLPDVPESQTEYFQIWKSREQETVRLLDSFLQSQPFGDWKAVKTVLERLPDQAGLHLANSMSVRYASLSSPFIKSKGWTAFSNRGTSGIDGCTGTAVGHAIADDRLQVLITGDQAFFYDRNALWHRHLPANLRIILINNRGGGIFRLIDGPANQPELETYFEAGQSLTAERTAADHGLDYYNCQHAEGLEDILGHFFNGKPHPGILEIHTDPEVNQTVYGELKKLLMQR